MFTHSQVFSQSIGRKNGGVKHHWSKPWRCKSWLSNSQIRVWQTHILAPYRLATPHGPTNFLSGEVHSGTSFRQTAYCRTAVPLHLLITRLKTISPQQRDGGRRRRLICLPATPSTWLKTEIPSDIWQSNKPAGECSSVSLLLPPLKCCAIAAQFFCGAWLLVVVFEGREWADGGEPQARKMNNSRSRLRVTWLPAERTRVLKAL